MVINQKLTLERSTYDSDVFFTILFCVSNARYNTYNASHNHRRQLRGESKRNNCPKKKFRSAMYPLIFGLN